MVVFFIIFFSYGCYLGMGVHGAPQAAILEVISHLNYSIYDLHPLTPAPHQFSLEQGLANYGLQIVCWLFL